MTVSEQPEAESRFVDAVRGMLARPDYLIPLAAAERQFRDHYYGLNSAALLEDLFFDALGNFLRQTHPVTKWTRPQTGQKGWDYSFDGLQISHKVSQDLGDVAALWDATKQGVTHWSFDEPIVYVLGKNAPSTGVTVELDFSTRVQCRAVADLGPPYELRGRSLMVVCWPADGTNPRLLEILASESGQRAVDVLSFSRIWQYVASHVAGGGAANDIDVLVTHKPLPRMLVDLVASRDDPEHVGISAKLRGGVYLLRRDLLQDLPVKTNNRAILIPKDTVRTLLGEAVLKGLFAPLPLWYWVYAQGRPPDMYSAQRGEYEARFSARGDLDLP